MTCARALHSAGIVMDKALTRSELEALARDAPIITADYAMLISAALKADGMPRGFCEGFLAQLISAGLDAKNSILAELKRLDGDGSGYRIIEEEDSE